MIWEGPSSSVVPGSRIPRHCDPLTQLPYGNPMRDQFSKRANSLFLCVGIVVNAVKIANVLLLTKGPF